MKLARKENNLGRNGVALAAAVAFSVSAINPAIAQDKRGSDSVDLGAGPIAPAPVKPEAKAGAVSTQQPSSNTKPASEQVRFQPAELNAFISLVKAGSKNQQYHLLSMDPKAVASAILKCDAVVSALYDEPPQGSAMRPVYDQAVSVLGSEADARYFMTYYLGMLLVKANNMVHSRGDVGDEKTAFALEAVLYPIVRGNSSESTRYDQPARFINPLNELYGKLLGIPTGAPVPFRTPVSWQNSQTASTPKPFIYMPQLLPAPRVQVSGGEGTKLLTGAPTAELLVSVGNNPDSAKALSEGFANLAKEPTPAQGQAFAALLLATVTEQSVINYLNDKTSGTSIIEDLQAGNIQQALEKLRRGPLDPRQLGELGFMIVDADQRPPSVAGLSLGFRLIEPERYYTWLSALHRPPREEESRSLPFKLLYYSLTAHRMRYMISGDVSYFRPNFDTLALEPATLSCADGSSSLTCPVYGVTDYWGATVGVGVGGIKFNTPMELMLYATPGFVKSQIDARLNLQGIGDDQTSFSGDWKFVFQGGLDFALPGYFGGRSAVRFERFGLDAGYYHPGLGIGADTTISLNWIDRASDRWQTDLTPGYFNLEGAHIPSMKLEPLTYTHAFNDDISVRLRPAYSASHDYERSVTHHSLGGGIDARLGPVTLSVGGAAQTAIGPKRETYLFRRDDGNRWSPAVHAQVSVDIPLGTQSTPTATRAKGVDVTTGIEAAQSAIRVARSKLAAIPPADLNTSKGIIDMARIAHGLRDDLNRKVPETDPVRIKHTERFESALDLLSQGKLREGLEALDGIPRLSPAPSQKK